MIGMFDMCGCCGSGSTPSGTCATGQVCIDIYNPVTLAFLGGRTLERLTSSGTVAATCTSAGSSGNYCCFTGVPPGNVNFKINSTHNECDSTNTILVSGCQLVQRLYPYCCQAACYTAAFPFTLTGSINFRTNVYASGQPCDSGNFFADIFTLVNQPITSGVSYSGCGYALRTMLAGEVALINSGNITYSTTVLKNYFTPNFSGGGDYGYGACVSQPWDWCNETLTNYDFTGLGFKHCNAFLPTNPCGVASGCSECAASTSTSNFYITTQRQCADKTLLIDTWPTNSGLWGTEAGNTIALNFYDASYSGGNFTHWNSDPLNDSTWYFEWRSDCLTGQFSTKGSFPFYYTNMYISLIWQPGSLDLVAFYGDDCTFFPASLSAGNITASGNVCDPAYVSVDGIGTVYE